jgi:micrococcal nuclease
MYEYKARLVRIIDGGTIDADIDLGFQIHIGQRIKLFGVDAPDARSKDHVERDNGFASKNRLIELLPKEIIVQTMLNKRGKVGRILGIVFIKEEHGELTNINDLIIKEGFATRYPSNEDK